MSKPIDDAMIIAAMRSHQDKGGCAATWLQLLTGQDFDDCVKALADAEARGLIRYELVDKSMRFVSCEFPDAKPEDGWNKLVKQLTRDIRELSVRIDRIEQRIILDIKALHKRIDELTDTIHDEEGVQDV